MNKKKWISGLLAVPVLLISLTAQQSDTSSELIDAILNNNLAKVKTTFADKQKIKKIKINEQIHQGDNMYTTYLNSALTSGNTDMVKFILSKKPDVNLNPKGQFGQTPLALSASLGSAEFINLLIDAKAQVDKKTLHGVTPLMVAASNGKLEAVRALLNRKANVRLTSALGQNMILLAAIGGNPDVLKIFLDKKYRLDVNAKDKTGNTPLNQAFERNNKPVMELLVAAGAKDPRVKDAIVESTPEKTVKKKSKK